MRGLALIALLLLATSYTGSQSRPIPEPADSFDVLNREVITLNEKLKQYGKSEIDGANDGADSGDIVLVDQEIGQGVK